MPSRHHRNYLSWRFPQASWPSYGAFSLFFPSSCCSSSSASSKVSSYCICLYIHVYSSTKTPFSFLSFAKLMSVLLLDLLLLLLDLLILLLLWGISVIGLVSTQSCYCAYPYVWLNKLCQLYFRLNSCNRGLLPCIYIYINIYIIDVDGIRI